MWSPTHVKVIVQRAKGLLTKGKNGTNDAYVTIELGKEKYLTSVKEKTVDPEWREECELSILCEESTILLTVLHRNFLGLDEFLGLVSININDYDFYDTPKNRWFPLQSKASKKETSGTKKQRGDLEVFLSFVVRSAHLTSSLTDLSSKKSRYKLGLKNLASSMGNKLSKIPARTLSLKLESPDLRRLSLPRLPRLASPDFSTPTEPPPKYAEDSQHQQLTSDLTRIQEEDTMVPLDIDEDDRRPPPTRHMSVPAEDWMRLIAPPVTRHVKSEKSSLQQPPPAIPSQPPPQYKSRSSSIEALKPQVPNHKPLPQDLLQAFGNFSHQELVELSTYQHLELETQRGRIQDLEDYLDHLLARVMENSPRLLQSPISAPRIM